VLLYFPITDRKWGLHQGLIVLETNKHGTHQDRVNAEMFLEVIKYNFPAIANAG
jgi:hypothetical protein